jgi:hypothetical protein
MVSDVEPMALPSKNVGGEFVGKVSITGLSSKLDAGCDIQVIRNIDTRS